MQSSLAVSFTDKRVDAGGSAGDLDDREILACADTETGNTTYCCLYKGDGDVDLVNNPYICCSDHRRMFEAAPAKYFAGASIATSWPARTPQTSSSPTLAVDNSSASTKVSAASPEGMASLSPGSKAGIGIGTVLVASLGVALASIFYRQWRGGRVARRRSSNDLHCHQEEVKDLPTRSSCGTCATLDDRISPASPNSGPFELHVKDLRVELPANEREQPVNEG